MHKISKITLNNFKFFYGKVEIPVERKNLLIYGENGSGKSSIYWSLYTFLQSVFKDNAEIRKYFEPKHPENLINRYSVEPSNSSIKLELKEDDGTVEEKEISINQITTKTGGLVKELTLGSDFINHHTLSRIYAYYHKEEINLFTIFEHELLAFIIFKNALIKQGETATNQNAEVWWEYIRDFIPKINDKAIIEKYLNDFNESFATYLNEITELTNTYITSRFRENFNILFEYLPASYPLPEEQKEEEELVLNQEVKKPQIIMTVKMLTDKIKEDQKKIIDSPQSFLNEAKLSTIALALRLAILDEKFVAAYPKVLILDDILMSMDMSNREFIFGILFENYLQDYQIIFLTHQKGLFEDARIYIENHYTEKARLAGYQNREIQKIAWKDHWKLLEMYEAENGNGIPIPHIVEYESSIHKAIKYFKYQVDYNACGNNLRITLEEFFRSYLPHKYFVDGTGRPIAENSIMLDGLLVKVREYFTEVGFELYPIDKLDRYRVRSLNPTSHFNPKTDYFKRELEDIFLLIQKLKGNRNEAVLKKDEKIKFEIKTTMGETYCYTAILLDDICLYQKFDGSPSFFVNTDERGYIMIGCTTDDKSTQILDHEINRSTLKHLYDDTIAFINKNKIAIVETDMYKVFTDVNGNTLNYLKKY